MYKCYIDGQLVDGARGQLDVMNPGTEEVAGRVSLIDGRQGELALEAAERGFATWSAYTVEEREGWIKKLQKAIHDQEEKIVTTLMEETGKLRDGAVEDYQMLLDCLTFFPEEARQIKTESIQVPGDSHDNLIVREPVGVVVAYLAWNFPLLNLGYKLGPVLASGCSCIIKPAEVTPLATLMIGEIMASINFPKGVVNIVLGDVMELTKVLNASTIPQMITVIGSTQTGKKVIEDSLTSIKKFSLELGGNAPAVVMKDFDPSLAAKILTEFKYANCGQICVSPNRVFVHEDHYEEFLKVAKDIALNLKPGWGNDQGSCISPMITDRSRQRILQMVKDDLKLGARLVTGGQVPKDVSKGYYVMPTILADVTPDMRCYKEEIFGPILPVIKYDDQFDLIEAANDTEFGLTSYIFTHDQEVINKFAKGVRSGTVCVNQPKYSVELPHGGVKNSGIGKDCSKYSLEEYYYIKRISILKEK